ncbi:MAG: bifunctional diaminohydroxyphosphoribosylaminopyrimidine deaminase/5-amino-6-(5-phosphoribosylamino)uracil reductase RibD [Deltaproteobacteria bacterium]|nr:bifunctional diaminohydroxyphosphoribosylaminopyrimidine deaminase/5-amino-6-(5-phosphoribosylamino)uracil reductase RibD [Deltaproteobacteria bacterium]
MPHAEIEALNNDTDLQNATLYITLEPCCHHGRTPPCTDAILKSGIREVVIGMRDPDKKVEGKGIQILQAHGIQVREGVMKKECEFLNEAYIKHRKKGVPFVILKLASTLDGRLTRAKGEPRWISGPESRDHVHQIRNTVDAILVGLETVRKDNPQLTTRLKGQKGHDPIRVILDSRLRISSKAKVLHLKSSAPTWVATTVSKKHRRLPWFQQKGIEILFCRKDSKGRVDLKDLLKQLGKREIVQLLVEGGATVAESFLKQKLADRFILFFAPSLMGETSIRQLSGRKMGPDLMVEGHIG